jgi:hypothetical protein
LGCARGAGPRHDGWWAVGSTALGLSLPTPLVAELRVAAADLSGGMLGPQASAPPPPGPGPGPDQL